MHFVELFLNFVEELQIFLVGLDPFGNHRRLVHPFFDFATRSAPSMATLILKTLLAENMVAWFKDGYLHGKTATQPAVEIRFKSSTEFECHLHDLV